VTTALTDPQLEALGILVTSGECFSYGGRYRPPNSVHPATANKLVALRLARVLDTGAITITDAGRAQYERAMGR
jgi:hypothetical protein